MKWPYEMKIFKIFCCFLRGLSETSWIASPHIMMLWQTFREQNMWCNRISAEIRRGNMLRISPLCCLLLPIGGAHLHCRAPYPDQFFSALPNLIWKSIFLHFLINYSSCVGRWLWRNLLSDQEDKVMLFGHHMHEAHCGAVRIKSVQFCHWSSAVTGSLLITLHRYLLKDKIFPNQTNS